MSYGMAFWIEIWLSILRVRLWHVSSSIFNRDRLNSSGSCCPAAPARPRVGRRTNSPRLASRAKVPRADSGCRAVDGAVGLRPVLRHGGRLWRAQRLRRQLRHRLPLLICSFPPRTRSFRKPFLSDAQFTHCYAGRASIATRVSLYSSPSTAGGATTNT